jgi:hypothetical protein
MTHKYLSPIIFRGTPSESPCIDASRGSILDSSTDEDATTPQSTRSQLEYSFLANALAATTILATPPIKVTRIHTFINTKSAAKTHDRLGGMPGRKDRPASSKSYAFIGAAPYKTAPARTIDAEMTNSTPATRGPTCSDGSCHSVPWKKQRTPTRCYQDDGRGRDDKINNSGVVNPKSILLTPKAQADSIDVFSTDSAPDALGSNESQNVQFSNLSDRVIMPGKSQAFKKDSVLESISDRVKFLEKTVWLDRGKEKEYKDEIRALKEELEEEIALNKELTHKVFELKRDTETAHEVHTKTEENMRLTVEGLAFELESEKSERAMTIQEHSLVMQSLQSQMSWHKSKIEDDTKALQVSQIEVSNEAENETTEELRRINKELLKKQNAIERELASCANDNDNLRGCLLSHASNASAKEQTLSSALSQLKSLSENYYQVTQSLEYEKNARTDEGTSLQWSLDDVSRQMVLLSKAVNELQSENHLLRSDMKRQSLERQRSLLFHRGARGG